MYNLKKGFQQIKLTKTKPEIEAFKLEVQNEFNVKETQMYRYFNGSTELKVGQLARMVAIFEKHGVKKSTIL